MKISHSIKLAWLAVAVSLATGSETLSQARPTVHSVTKPQIGAVEAAVSVRNGTDTKISSQLLDALTQEQTAKSLRVRRT